MVNKNNGDISNQVLEILKAIFENINRWLNFAEAKNGTLIGVNGLFLFKCIDYLINSNKTGLNLSVKIYLGIMASVFLIVILISLNSFFPNTSVCKDKSNILDNDNLDVGKTKNLIFYENIAEYKGSKLYLLDIYKYYLETNIKIDELKKIELDYASEILINSQIASYKYKCFKTALGLNFFGIFLFLIFLIIA